MGHEKIWYSRVFITWGVVREIYFSPTISHRKRGAKNENTVQRSLTHSNTDLTKTMGRGGWGARKSNKGK